MRSYLEAEMVKLLPQMYPTKSPDRTTSPLVSSNTIGRNVTRLVFLILNGGSMDPSLDYNFIYLVPKHCNSISITNFRPISLCNFIYKLVSKIFVNKLKSYMDSIISSSQSTFIPSKIIKDNILITHELLHTMKYNIKGKKGKMAVKLDMSKAYNWVKLTFLK